MNAHPRFETQHITSTLGRFGLGIIVVFMLGASLATAQPVVGQATSGTLEGIVVSEGESPIGSAEIVATKYIAGDIAETKSTTSASEGTFSMTLTIGTWNVTTRADGFGTNHTAVEIKSGETTAVKIKLLPKWSASGSFLSGVVKDASTQEPVAGVRVELRAWDRSRGEGMRDTLTDAQGKYRIELFSGYNSVQFMRSGYATWYADAHSEGGDQTIDPLLQSVPRQTVTIVGKVVDDTGKPIQAQVQLQVDYDRVHHAEGGGTSGGSSGNTSSASPASDEPAKMSVICCYDNNWNSTITEKDGTFTMKAYPGEVILRADRRDHMIGETRLTLVDNQTHTVTLTVKSLPAKSVTLTGKVVDAKTGEPIPAAQVNAQVPVYGDYEWTSTDKDGKYTLTLRPGYTMLSVSYYKGHYAYAVDVAYDCPPEADCLSPEPSPAVQGPDREFYSRQLVFTTQAGESTRDVKLQPKPEPATTVVGYVIDSATDKGIAGAQVSIYNQATGDWGSAATDENGSYKFLVRGGYTTFYVWAEGFLPYGTDVTVPSSGSERVDLGLTAGKQGQVGWWDPDGGHYGCGDYGGPCPMAVEEASADSDGGMKAGAPMRSSGGMDDMGARSLAAGGEADGAEVAGGAGGLPAYDPDKKGSTFGNGGTEESPPLAMALVLALGMLALWVGVRMPRKRHE